MGVAPFPPEIIELLTAHREPAPLPAASGYKPGDGYGAAALASEAARVRSAANGTRNDTLNRAAFVLGQLVAAGALDKATVESELTSAALAAGLGEVETAKTIQSGLEDGAKEPRVIPDPKAEGRIQPEPPPDPPDDPYNEPTPAADSKQGGVVIHWAAEALEPQPPIAWLVDKLFAVGSVALVVGEGGAKKTYAMADMAVCAALGLDWLLFPTQQGTALIVDEESGPRRLNRRLGELMRAHGAGADIPLAYTSLASFNLRTPGMVDLLDKVIAETRARLVVIDALADIMAGGDENAVKDTQPVFMALRRLADKYEAAIVVIHHTGKNGDYRGSSALKGAVDALIKVTSQPKGRQINFEIEKQRDVEPFKFAASIAFEPDRTVITAADALASKKLNPGQAYAMRYLAEHGPSLLTAVIAAPDTCSSEAARLGVYGLAKDGYAKRTDAGGKGRPAEYTLTPMGQQRYRQEAEAE